MKIIRSSKNANLKQRIMASDADFFADEDEALTDSMDEISDNVEDLQDQLDDIDEDDVSIDMDNNITNHYIAECSRCHGIFISAMLESDQKVEKVTGTCPLCEKESDQYLKWGVHEVNND